MADSLISGDGVADAFDVPIFSELSGSSRLLAGASIKDSALEAKLPPLPELPLDYVHEAGPPPTSLDLPPLADIHLVPLDDQAESTVLDSLSISSGTTGSSHKLDAIPDEDVWQLTRQLPSLKTEPTLLSWDAFLNSAQSAKPRPLYLSEAGPRVFDAVICRRAGTSNQPSSAAVQQRPLFRSLWQLGLGRESALFPFDKRRDCFKQALQHSHAHGVTFECSKSLIDSFLLAANSTRRLRTFIDACFMTNGILPAVVSFAHAVDVVLSAIEAHTTETGKAICTLLQLQSHFEPVHELLKALNELADRAEQSPSELDFLNAVFAYVQTQEHASEGHQRILEQILARSSSNWLQNIDKRVALVSNFEAQLLEAVAEEYTQHSTPNFVTGDDCRLINETVACLQHLHTHHGADAIVHRLQTASVDGARLAWEFDWDDLNRIQHKAEKYHADVRQALLGHTHGLDALSNQGGNQEHDGLFNFSHGIAQPSAETDEFLTDPDELDQLPVLPLDSPKDELHESVKKFLTPRTAESEDYADIRPPLSLTASSSIRPLLRAQNQLLSYLTAHALLHKQDLKTHLELHYAFSFFASGLFTARLQHVLFSSETQSAERQGGRVRTGGSGRGVSTGMGLKLGSGERQTWPPASSEVRLALMGLLGDVWREEQALAAPSRTISTQQRDQSVSKQQNVLTAVGDDVLPGNLSFSIRTDLPDTMIERILNADSIAALDFLKLTYEPPDPLEPLFTTRTLDLYDRVFGLWLRFVRVTAALSSIFDLCRNLRRVTISKNQSRQIFKLRYAAHTFISTLTTHLRIAGIDAPWSGFMNELGTLASSCADPVPPPLDLSSNTQSQKVPSLATLQILHEQTLNKITANLLLRKKHRRAAEALEGACEDVLAFARRLQSLVAVNESSATDKDTEDGDAKSIIEIDTSFEAHVSDFKNACEALIDESEKKTTPVSDDDGIACLKDLLSVLDTQQHHKRHQDAP